MAVRDTLKMVVKNGGQEKMRQEPLKYFIKKVVYIKHISFAFLLPLQDAAAAINLGIFRMNLEPSGFNSTIIFCSLNVVFI